MASFISRKISVNSPITLDDKIRKLPEPYTASVEAEIAAYCRMHRIRHKVFFHH